MTNILKEKKLSISIIFISLTILASTNMVYFSFTNAYIFFVVTIILILKNNTLVYNVNIRHFIIVCILSFYASIPGETEHFRNLSAFILLPFMFLLSEENKEKIFKIVSVIFAVSLIPALIDTLSTAILNVNVFPVLSVKYFDDRIYYSYPFFVKELSFQSVPINRLQGLYDEPGFVGTIGALILISDKMDIKKWNVVLLFVACIFTFSLAFYIIIAMYLFYMLVKNMGTKAIKYAIIISLFACFLYYIINEYIDLYILRRIFEGERLIIPSGRKEMSDFEFLSYFFAQDVFHIFFGHGYGSHRISTNLYEYSSWIRIPYDYGLMFVIIFIYFIRSIWSEKANKIFLILFLLSIYQRPQIFTPFHFFLIAYNSTSFKENLLEASNMDNLRIVDKKEVNI